MDYAKFFDANRRLWDQKISVHQNSAFYDQESFLQGASTLKHFERDALGDVSGKSLLHLQCHFGQDTLSWARLGARATGMDLSGEAIALARQLNEQLGLDAHFVESNVYDLPENLQGRFDIVFTSYGVIGWLPDLDRWAEVINHFLKPGGTFYMIEFHPLVWMFDDDFTTFAYPYHNAGVIEIDQQGTYADRDAGIGGKEYGWNHSLSEVISALLRQGLTLTAFQEHDYSPHDCFAQTEEIAPGKWQIKPLGNKIAYVYEVMAQK